MTAGGGKGPELAIEIEFEQLWENSEEEMNLAREGRKRELERKRKLWEDREEGEDISLEEEVGNDHGGWPLEDQDKLAMKRERERCTSLTKRGRRKVAS